MKVENKTQAILLLLVLIAIGGMVMYGKDKNAPTLKKARTSEMPLVPPVIKGPTTPPPSYESSR